MIDEGIAQKTMAYIIITILSLSSYGCTHLHDEAYSKKSDEIKAEFNNYKTSSDELYTNMLENLNTIKATEAKRDEEATNARETEVIENLQQQKWSDIQTGIYDVINEQAKIDEEKEDIEAIKAKLQQHINNIKAELKAKSKKLENAVLEENLWNARQELFRGALNYAVTVIVDEDKTLDEKTLKEAKEEILGKIVQIKKLENDKIVTAESKVSEVLNKDNEATAIGEKLKNNDLVGAKESLADVIKNYTYGNFDPNSAPGLTVTLMSMGVDLAETAKERAELELKYQKAKLDLLNAKSKTAKFINDYTLEAAITINDRFGEGNFKPDETVQEYFVRELKSDETNKDAVGDAFKVCCYYAMSQTMDYVDPLVLKRQEAEIDHEYSIRISQVNAKEHEALISRGIEGIAIYHNGGLMPSQVANFLNSLQVVALGVIGAGVL